MSSPVHFQCDINCHTPNSSHSLPFLTTRKPSPPPCPTKDTQKTTRPIFRSKSATTLSATPLANRRLSSGSACDTCRKRKTKCDGNQPCAFCVCNDKACTHTPNVRRKRAPSVSGPGSLSRTSARHSRQFYLGLPWLPKEDDKYSQDYVYRRSSEQKTRLVTKPDYPLLFPWRQEDLKPKPNHFDSHLSPISQTCLPIVLDTFQDLQNAQSKEEIPSIVDQLSCLTFSAATLDRNTNYPIYPLSLHVINRFPPRHVSPYLSLQI
ncbi:hypothetical protein CLU79DRAFT_757316 [Phycomyces nitens]|nr:hypothetical protein CLU79DRAFT_757316 [Phycomyces nitens]